MNNLKQMLFAEGCAAVLITYFTTIKRTYVVATARPFDLAGQISHITFPARF